MKSPNAVTSSTRESLSSPPNGLTNLPNLFANSSMKISNQPRKRWILPDFDQAAEANMSFPEESPVFLGEKGAGVNYQNGGNKPNGLTSVVPADENIPSNLAVTGTGLMSTQIHFISQKFREILRLKKGMQDFPISENFTTLNSLNNVSSQSLSSLVLAIIGDKQPEEVPALVEFMLKKVMEEFERRLVIQGDQVIKLQNSLKEHISKEERLASRAKLLETLAAGTGEEVKLVFNQLQKVKIEKRQAEEEIKVKAEEVVNLLREKDEKQILIKDLKEELEMVKCMNQEHILQLEVEKKELEAGLQVKLKELEFSLEESRKKVVELEAMSAFEMESVKKKDIQYQNLISFQLQSFQDLKRVSEISKQEIKGMQSCWHKEIEGLEEQLQGLAHAAAGYHKVLAENRQLYNEVQDLKGNIRVYCRVRPFVPGQFGKPSSVDFIGQSGDILIANPNKQGKDGLKMFSFNKIFGDSTTQEEVFVDTQPLIRSVLDGYKVCIFAYGQTGSGKTYTMSGPAPASEKDWGVNYRALSDLFQICQNRKDVIKYEVGVQMIEIYNEQVRDLVASDGPSKRLGIRNNSQLNGLNVPDASMVPVNSTEDVLELMKIGQQNRAVGATALNERSSRSHSVLTVHVQGTDLASGTILRGCLHLVDLAGSERVERSEATGDRLREAQHINKSLSALGDVISALAQKNAHVPYRNSKLTQLLQDSLGGQAKTLMFVHISPDVESYGETISTLKFAERVASVELGAARSNKESKEVRELKEQIASLKEMLAKKETETERVHVGKDSRTHNTENTAGFEKLKGKFVSSSSQHHKAMGEVQQQRSHIHVLHGFEGRSHTQSGRAQKRLLVPSFHDTLSQESEPSSPARSPRELKMLAGAGDEVSHFLNRNVFSQNKAPDSEVNPAHTLSQVKHKARCDLATEQDATSKELQERVKSSTDSSLLGTASLDSFSWDSGHTGNIDGEPLVPYTSDPSMHVRSVLEKKKHNKIGEVNPRELPVTLSGDVLRKELELKRRNRYVLDSSCEMDIRIDRIEQRDVDVEDRASEISDGEISLADTEVSLLGATELSSQNSEKVNRGTVAKLQPPHATSRTERRSLCGVTVHPQTRRQSVIVSALVPTASSKRKASVGAKHNVESEVSSLSSDGGLEFSQRLVPIRPNLSSQVATGCKGSKRWL